MGWQRLCFRGYYRVVSEPHPRLCYFGSRGSIEARPAGVRSKARYLSTSSNDKRIVNQCHDIAQNHIRYPPLKVLSPVTDAALIFFGLLTAMAAPTAR